MPTYVYECPFCLEREEHFRKIDERDDAPRCHNRSMQRVIMATMVSVFSPYQAAAVDKDTGRRPLIRSRAEHEAFLRRNGYEEVGNDKSMAPPSREEVADRKQRWADAPHAPMVDVDKLKREGWVQEDLV